MKKLWVSSILLLISTLASIQAIAASANPFNQAIKAIQYGQLYCPTAYSTKAVQFIKKHFAYAYPIKTLGCEYEYPATVKAQMTQAFNITLQNAKKGNPQAQYKVGLAYFYGIGVKANLKQYIHWIVQAANQNYLPALEEKWYLLQTRLIKFDNAKETANALRILKQKLITANTPSSLFYAASIEMNQNNRLQQIGAWLKKSAEQGFANAQFSYAVYLLMPEEKPSALYWFLKSADNPKSTVYNAGSVCWYIGMMYTNGQGGAPHDQAKAKPWFNCTRLLLPKSKKGFKPVPLAFENEGAS